MYTTRQSKESMINEGGHIANEVEMGAQRVRNDAAAAAADAADAMREDIKGTARRAGQHVHNMAAAAEQNATDVANSMKGKIQDNPVQSTLIALGVGFVVGLIFRR